MGVHRLKLFSILAIADLITQYCRERSLSRFVQHIRQTQNTNWTAQQIWETVSCKREAQKISQDMLTCLLLTLRCFLGSKSTSMDWEPPFVLNFTFPSRLFLLAALALWTAAAASNSKYSSTYQSCLLQSSLTAHPSSSMCLQFPYLHLQHIEILPCFKGAAESPIEVKERQENSFRIWWWDMEEDRNILLGLSQNSTWCCHLAA